MPELSVPVTCPNIFVHVHCEFHLVLVVQILARLRNDDPPTDSCAHRRSLVFELQPVKNASAQCASSVPSLDMFDRTLRTLCVCIRDTRTERETSVKHAYRHDCSAHKQHRKCMTEISFKENLCRLTLKKGKHVQGYQLITQRPACFFNSQTGKKACSL